MKYFNTHFSAYFDPTAALGNIEREMGCAHVLASRSNNRIMSNQKEYDNYSLA